MDMSSSFSRMSTLLSPACKDFEDMKVRNEMRIILVGKQHHGKSSFTNHMMRCLQQKMDIADEVETGPQCEFETTVDTKPIKMTFQDTFHFVVYDTPAFSTLTLEKC